MDHAACMRRWMRDARLSVISPVSKPVSNEGTPVPRNQQHKSLPWTHVLRSRLARRFLRKIKRASHRGPPRLVVPSARRALVIAPHMDDEVIPCGGTLIILRESGAEVHVAYVSDSSAGSSRAENALTQVRKKEAREVREFLQFTTVKYLDFPDGGLFKHEAAIVSALAEHIQEVRPDLILCPFPADAHSDHMSCAWATAAATNLVAWRGSIFAYEVWTPSWPNVAVDITQVAERKKDAIRLYRSQVEDRDYAAAALGLNRFRGMAHQVRYAEAFFCSSPAEFNRLAGMLNEL